MAAMRLTSSALIGVLLIASGGHRLAAAETGSRWWPFGQRDEARVAQPPLVAAPSQSSRQTPHPHSASNPGQPSAAASPRFEQPSQSPERNAEATANEHWMLSSPKRKIGWPRLATPQMPRTGLFAQKAEPDATRNSWLEKTPAEPKPSPLKPIRDGAQRVAQNTKAAWNKTIDAITPGEPAPETAPRSSGSRVARNEPQPRFWQRLLGQEEELNQPQTVPEWMAQERVDRR
jgi:hypothetical protein